MISSLSHMVPGERREIDDLAFTLDSRDGKTFYVYEWDGRRWWGVQTGSLKKIEKWLAKRPAEEPLTQQSLF